ncbi:MAG: PqqD family protein, partial [Desulfobacteraceae bacterium]|nr:PqqD family protein [Desulfobacteraceae bacterium]
SRSTRLFREKGGQTQPLCTVNYTGKTISEACDGRNSLRDISRLVQQTYEISSHQAYVDCLTFLVQLKNIGAIQL